MAVVALWFGDPDAIGGGNAKLLMVFIGMVALALVVQAIVSVLLAIKGAQALKIAMATLEEFKAKTLPLIASATEIGVTTHAMVRDAAPKVKVITDNLLVTSHIVKSSAQDIDKTVSDVNVRTKKQVARVDGMVTAALTTTAEIAETVNNGIRGPLNKIAEMAIQAKILVDGAVAKAKVMAAGFAGRGGR